MINKFLTAIFGISSYDRYTPKPYHLGYSLFLMLLGTLTFIRDGWFWFGTITFDLGVGLGIVIVLGIAWDKFIEYWDNINEHIRLMSKVKDSDLWYALGYKMPPQSIQIEENIDTGQGFITTKYHQLPISSTIMQTIADTILSGSPFSENEIVNRRKIMSAPKYRELQKYMESKSMLKPHNAKRRNQGFALTRKGQEVMYQYASESIRLEKNEI